jgi:hypothetical protein
VITTTATIRAAIQVAQPLTVACWVELDDWIDCRQVTFDRGALVHTRDLMELWRVSQPTVSRRLAKIRKAGLAEIVNASGIQGGWWVKR